MYNRHLPCSMLLLQNSLSFLFLQIPQFYEVCTNSYATCYTSLFLATKMPFTSHSFQSLAPDSLFYPLSSMNTINITGDYNIQLGNLYKTLSLQLCILTFKDFFPLFHFLHSFLWLYSTNEQLFHCLQNLEFKYSTLTHVPLFPTQLLTPTPLILQNHQLL